MKKRMILLDVLLCILITFTAACFSIKPLVTKTISTDMSGTAISHQFMDFVYKEFSACLQGHCHLSCLPAIQTIVLTER